MHALNTFIPQAIVGTRSAQLPTALDIATNVLALAAAKIELANFEPGAQVACQFDVGHATWQRTGIAGELHEVEQNTPARHSEIYQTAS